MPLSTIPEILRSNLLSVALQLIALGIDDLANFDFINKPSVELINSALDELEQLGAVKKLNQIAINTENDSNKKKLINIKYELTDIGRKMSQFPLDPKLSRCILNAERLNCLEDCLKIVSILSVDNVFHNHTTMLSSSKRDQAHMIRQKFASSDGDHITLLNIYKAFVSNSKNKDWCHENLLDYKNLKLAVDICKQLRDICVRYGIKMGAAPLDTVNLRHALISGFFMNAAEYQKENEYKTVRHY
jgi:ATP-dependent RNA helicase DHX33